MACVGTGNPFLSRTSLRFLWISLTFHSRLDLCLHTDFCMRALSCSPLRCCGSTPAKMLAGPRLPSAQSRSNLCREASSSASLQRSRVFGGSEEGNMHVSCAAGPGAVLCFRAAQPTRSSQPPVGSALVCVRWAGSGQSTGAANLGPQGHVPAKENQRWRFCCKGVGG